MSKRLVAYIMFALPVCISPIIATAQTREERHDACVINCEYWMDVDLGQYTKCYQKCEDEAGYGEPAPQGDPDRYPLPDVPTTNCASYIKHLCVGDEKPR